MGPGDGALPGGLCRAGKAVEDGEGRLAGEAGLSWSQRPPRFSFSFLQGNSSSDTRDMYVPNPSCKDFAKYEWIGQLMGAALRSKEILVSTAKPMPPVPVRQWVQEGCGEDTSPLPLQVLSLPGLVWKQLAGEEVIWSKDFAAVDAELVSAAGAMPCAPTAAPALP